MIMERTKERNGKMNKWLQRRCGWDELTVALVILYLLSCAAAAVWELRILAAASLVLFGYTSWRLFSRNLLARQAENTAFLRIFTAPRNRLRIIRMERRDREHRYCICRNCSAVLRVPRGLGKIEITCPRCKEKSRKKV